MSETSFLLKDGYIIPYFVLNAQVGRVKKIEGDKTE